MVMRDEQEIGRITLDELCCVILSAERATVSKSLMVRLAELGVPLIVCGSNYLPISITLPLSAHHLSSAMLDAQIAASLPLKKNLWQQIIKLKIKNQRTILDLNHANVKTPLRQLQRLANNVTSGDSQNHEAQAARLYWSSLMGKDFRRRQQAEDTVNSALNYGYAVIRAACARAIVGAGLNPSLGLHHKNKRNTFCLADDLMEFYRPLIDHIVISTDFDDELSQQNKRDLAQVLQLDISFDGVTTTVNTSMQRSATSLARCFETGSKDLQLPKLI